ncbi:MAG: InlB B-repeat-containing protein, partial [Lachnospiraceae bacterium]|nr:InlB B-repeat-containing protein [Lachnospiraceae bacterium]
ESEPTKESGEAESESVEDSCESDSTLSEENSKESETESESEPESETETETEKKANKKKILTEEKSFSVNLPDEIPFEIGGTDIFAGLNQSDLDLNTADVSASVYDPRVSAPDTMTPVKNQNPYGTCWAFATTAIMENSMIQQELANNSIDLSERHLAYFTYNTGSDRLGNAVGDTIVSSPEDTYLNRGGNTFLAAIKLMNWHGMASESDYPYSNVEGTLPARLSENDAQNVAALAHDFYFIPTDTATTEQKKSVVKELISKYGCVAWSYGHNDTYYKDSTYAYYNPNAGTNHAITVVGWDDNFSKDNFATTPAGDGAWIVKNSWGNERFGDKGYFYISYYDASLGSGNAASVAVACDKNQYDNNYFYGNTGLDVSVSVNKMAEVFEAKGSSRHEKLTAVSFMMASDKADYTIQIYKNPEKVNGVVENPETGTAMLDAPVTGTTGYAGLYTVDLKTPVTFAHGDTFAIVIEFDTQENVYIDCDYTIDGTYSIEYSDTTYPGQSFYAHSGAWIDSHNENENGDYTMRINALTVNVGDSGEEDTRYTVTFVDADGNVISTQTVKKGGNAVAPAAPIRKGYTFKGWSDSYQNITADTTLTAEYDLVKYKIQYVLNGGTNADTNPTTYTVESADITLAEPTQEGYLFMGWYEESDFSGTSVSVIAKGSTGDLTLYAKWEEETAGVMTPIFTPSSGIVDETQKITIKSNSGAEIYYTMDGTTPTVTNGIKYTDPFNISKDVTIKAIAVKDGETSAVAETQYLFYLISLELSDTELTLTKGDTKSLTAVKLPTEREQKDIVWSSSDKSVATVSSDGVVTAVKKGTASITASTKDYMLREVSATCSVTVNSPKYTVIFKDADGNQIGEAQQVEEGKNAVPPTAPKREGYTFKGWSGSYQNIKADTTLTAEYMPTEYTITYVLDGGMNAEGNPAKYTIETETFILQSPSKDKAIFAGWYDNSDFKGNKIEKIEKGSTGNLKLYARWRKALGLYMTDVADQVYTGKAIQPTDFTVYDGDAELRKGIDYTVSYQNNVNANTTDYATTEEAQADKAPCIIIKGKGNYTGTVIKNFKIMPIDMESTVIDTVAVAYKAGATQTPKPVVKWNGKKLSQNKDYSLEMESGYTEPGTYEIKVCGKNNFTGEKSFDFIIAASEQKLISKVKKSKIPNQKYENTPITITENMLKLKDGQYTLIEGTDYTLEYDGTGTGTHEVLITGIGNYIGVTRTSFKILGTDISKASVKWDGDIIYDGTAQTPSPEITYKEEAVDYEVLSYSNNVNAGTAKMTIKGVGAYSGTRTLSFKIKPADVNDYAYMQLAGGYSQPYQKGGVRPQVIVTVGGMTMREGVDYTVSYKNNTAWPVKEDREPTVIVKGKKNLKGTGELTFDIAERNISDLNNVGLMLLPDVEYNSKPGNFYPKMQILDVNGKPLKAGVDYEKDIEYKDSQGNVLTKQSAPAEGEVITVTVRGKNVYRGEIQGTYRIISKGKNLSKAKVKVNRTFYYTDEDIELTKEDLTVTLNNQPVTEYSIVPYPNNPKKGKAKFLLVGEGAYGGQKTVTITIKSQSMKWWK